MMPNMGAYAQSPSYKHIFNAYADDAERNVEAVAVATKAALQKATIGGIECSTPILGKWK